jgi:hypothetical protein
VKIMKKRSGKLIAQLVGYVTGIGQQWPKGTNVQLNDETVSTKSLLEQFQEVIDADTDARAADKTHKKKVATANALASEAQPTAKAFKRYLLVTFGGNPETLGTFAVVEPTEPQVSAATKSAAAVKAAATRAALGTKGSRQKKEAKKQLAAQAQVQPAIPAEPAAPAAPVTPVTPPTGGTTPTGK